MNKKIMFSGVMMLVLLTSCGTQDITEGVSSVSESVTSVVEDVADTSIAGIVNEPVFLGQGFAEYDASLLGEAENTVLFFHQESCGTCKATETDLIENGIDSSIQVLKIDFDASENNELRQKYGVTMKHTFVQVDAEGNMIKKWSGSMSADDIEEQVSSEAMMEEDKEVMQKDEDIEAMMEKDESIEAEVMEKTELSGVYADYDASLVGESESTVLAFFAAWCPSCVAADTSISGSEVPDGLSILKVDYDAATDLRQKYGVTSQHTFVQVDSDGNLIKKWAGGTTVEDVVERVQ